MQGGETLYTIEYATIHIIICAILHIASTTEIQPCDFCKIEQPNLQNSTTIQPETLHLKSGDPGGIWNCNKLQQYIAYLLLTRVLWKWGLNRPHGPNRGDNVRNYTAATKTAYRGAAGLIGLLRGMALYRRTCRIPSEWAGCRDPVGRGATAACLRGFPRRE